MYPVVASAQPEAGSAPTASQPAESKNKEPTWSIISPEADRGLVHLLADEPHKPQSVIDTNVKFGVQWKAAIDRKNADTEQTLNAKWKGPFEDWLTERLNHEFKVRGGELMDWIRSVNSSTVGFHFAIRDPALGDIVARNSKWAKNLAKTLVFEQHAVNLVDFGCRWSGRFCCRRLV